MTDKLNKAITDLVGVLKTKTGANTFSSDADFIEFSAEGRNNNFGRGLVWTGHGEDKQFIFAQGDKFFSTENIDLAKNKVLMINAQPIISEKELGPTVTKSNLREIGRLKNLNVDGSVTFNDYLFFNAASDRLGLGTDLPNAALSIAEAGIEVIVGTEDSVRGKIGTYANHDLDIVTDNTSRINIDRSGNITIGNKRTGPIKTSIYGKLYVGSNNLDSRVDLHVDGAIKFNEKIHQYADKVPTTGDWNRGDVVWNSEPELGSFVGWVCVRAGSPGTWLPFGEIKTSK